MTALLERFGPSLQDSDTETKRAEIRSYFRYCYRRYEALFETLADEKAYYLRADVLRHPLIFYYGHTAVFYINKLKLAKLIDTRIDAHLESIFAVGVDEMSWDDLDTRHYDWPSVAYTREYRQKVYELVDGLIETMPLSLPITQDSPWWVILMGIEHENIHLETSSVLIRQLPLDSVHPHPRWAIATSQNANPPRNEWVHIPERTVVLGKRKDDDFYGWDNEYGRYTRHIPAFQAARYLTSNGEFRAFVESGGYDTKRYWSKEGWQWRAYVGATMPRFWRRDKQGYHLRTMCEEIAMPWAWPVEVNFHEAEAFCRFKSEQEGVHVTLPTEAEYESMRRFAFGDVCDIACLDQKKANIALGIVASSVPVDTYAHGDLYDVIGNVWQWTRTPIFPFEGFEVHPIYDDFSVPTFDGKHNLIKGGSWISCGNEALPWSRYAFRRHFYQHAGFRYIQSNDKEESVSSAYNTDTAVSQYAHFHWGENRFGVPNFPQICAQKALGYMGAKPKRRALEVGCALGRASFELAREFDEVTGVDFSARFIQEAIRLKESGTLRYATVREGELYDIHDITLNRFGLLHASKKVNFWQADACNLKPIFAGYDLVLACNVIDRLYDPAAFLETMKERIVSGGLLVLTSPYSWDETYTPKAKWLGGFKRDGENVESLQGIEEVLSSAFRLIATEDIEFVIQETARKHQHTVAQMSVWERV